MWLFRLGWRHLHWSASLLKKFFRLVPLPTLAVVALTLVSQLTKMLAFFLPLKVIILVGSTGIPRYFPASWAAFDRDALVVALSLAAIGFYVVFLVADKLLAAMANRGATGVLSHTRKLALFSNQDEVASEAYQRLVSGLATGVLALLLALLFAVIYPGFLLVMLAYLVLAALGVNLVGQRRVHYRAKLHENAKNIAGLLSGAGFLLLFAFMVTDFLLWGGAGFMAAIICLLLSRQLFNRLDGAFKDALWLHAKRLQVNAIFFTGHKLAPQQEGPRHRRFWALLALSEQPARLASVIEACRDAPLAEGSQLHACWRQSGLTDTHVFEVEVQAPEREPEHYLLKLFGIAQRKAALNEADLLASSTGKRLPAPELLGVAKWQGYDCHLFIKPEGELTESNRFRDQLPQRLAACWAVEPSRDLVRRYSRSHPLLHQRLNAPILQRLEAAAVNTPARQDVVQLAQRLDEVIAALGSLPLAIVNQGITRELAFTEPQGELLLGHWGRWALEPVGAAFPVGRRWRGALEPCLSQAIRHRPSLGGLSLEQVRLSACCSELEIRFRRQKYHDAIALIPEILACLPGTETPRAQPISEVP
ncbi:hypothetical protein BWR19_08420 [Halomonas sp. 1513]|nr:hypothetical protein [Halomonas sp. 1513]APX92952.1 hypothetical protein BWR19_08420 [Halomonas sp. 1513]